MIGVFGGTTGMIQVMNLTSWEAAYIGVVGFSDSDIREYLQHYYREDLWAQAGAKQALGTAHLLSDLVPAEVFQHSEIWNDFGKRVGPGVFHCVGATVDVGPRKIGMVGIRRPRDAIDFTRNERDLLRGLLPHLQRALMLSQRLTAAERSAALTYEAMDALAVGLVIAAADGVVIFANAAARGLSAAGDGFALGNGQTGLTAARPSETSELRMLIRRAARTTAGRGWAAGGVVRLSRPSLRRPYTVIVSPLPLRLGTEPAALVLVADPETHHHAPPDWLCRLYGMTPAEARLALALVNGESPKTYAASLDRSMPTIRTQLQSIFVKTDTRGQTDLVRTLTRALGNLSLRGDPPDRRR